MRNAFHHQDTERSGKPSSAVAIAFAWISGPGMVGVVDVAWTSCSASSVMPITTILLRKNPGLTLPRSVSE